MQVTFETMKNWKITHFTNFKTSFLKFVKNHDFCRIFISFKFAFSIYVQLQGVNMVHLSVLGEGNQRENAFVVASSANKVGRRANKLARYRLQ